MRIKPLRLRPRIVLSFLLFLLFLTLVRYTRGLWRTWKTLPEHWRHNIVLQQAPQALRPYVLPFADSTGPGGPPQPFPDVSSGVWAGSWQVPILSVPLYRRDTTTLVPSPQTPAFLMLHVFSTSRRGSRLRRELIRERNLLGAVPVEYRHLVEIKFVLGLPRPIGDGEKQTEGGQDLLREYDEEERRIREEQRQYGDIIRLDNLANGENMNQGKSLEWMRHVGGPGGREALWIFKCDDDTLPILPNFLDFLVKQDPSLPSYIGTTIGRWTGYHYYFEGMMYGFSWGVIKTIATANLSPEFITDNWDEDARMGTVMYNLPSIPLCSASNKVAPRHAPQARKTRTQCLLEAIPYDTPPPGGWNCVPLSPDPRSGLMRIDLGRRLGGWDAWAIPKNSRSIGWHYLKSDADYEAAYQRAQELFKAAGRPYLWEPPKRFRAFAEHVQGKTM